MKWFDRYLQKRRISKVRRYVRPHDRVLDIGSSDGALYHYLAADIHYIGLDPDFPGKRQIGPSACLVQGLFPEGLPDQEPYDVICMLAVLEHVPTSGQTPLAAACFRFLRPGGTLVITVPAPGVDRILGILRVLRVIDGMSLHQHYGYDVGKTVRLFEDAGLRSVAHQRFQLGLNNLFVFQRPATG